MTQDSTSSDITIVTATYDRAAVLDRVIRVVQCQTCQSWRWLIIGDACSDGTAEMIRAIGDDRIRFVNLPERFGEQAGPNNVGLALADTPYIAMLNHDDLWFPEHLDYAVSRLRQTGAGLTVTQAVSCWERGPNSPYPIYADSTRRDRSLADAYNARAYTIEPLSAWVGTREFFTALGPMKLASETAVPPMQDWAMRISQRDMAVDFAPEMTVVKPGRAGSYASDEGFAALAAQRILSGQCARLKQEIASDLWLSSQIGAAREGMEPAPDLRSPCDGYALHRHCGLDAPSLDALARGHAGTVIREALARRTGERILVQPAVEAAIRHARQHLD